MALIAPGPGGLNVAISMEFTLILLIRAGLNRHILIDFGRPFW